MGSQKLVECVELIPVHSEIPDQKTLSQITVGV